LRILKNQPARRQVIAATFALVVFFAVSALWSASRTWNERNREVEEQAGTIAATVSAYLKEYLNGLDSLASALSRHPAVIGLDAAQCTPLFADLLRSQPLLLNILVTDPDGVMRASALPIPPGVTADGRPYIEQVRTTGRPVVSELTTGAISGKPTIALAYPVRTPRGAIGGILVLALNLAQFQTLFATVPLPEGSVVTLTDGKSRVLARSRDGQQYIGTVIAGQTLPLREVPRTRILTGIDGESRFYGTAIVDRGPWLLSVGIPTSIAITRLTPLFRRNVFIITTALLSTFLMALLMSTGMSRGLARIRDSVQRIADGDLSPPVKMPVPNLELGQLQDAFITMAENLRRAHDALDHQVEEERKMREALQSLQRQVVRQERLAAVGVLVSGVAHELNNPLQAILGTAELLERRPELSAEVLEEIAFLKTQSGRAREIIRNLSRFSSQQSGPPSLVDLRDVIAEVVQLRTRDLDAVNIALDVETSTMRRVYANFTELEQVTLNFVINAQQSIEASGRQQGRILIRFFDAGKKVRLEVQDDGPGVSTEDEPKLFQPFFTTKPVGKGTGLGLSVSYGIIDSYGGTIGYRGNEQGGATFFFELPVADPAATLRPRATADGSSDSNDGPPLLHRRLPSNV
jgi:C4-dicarboxylate-specific signal transduction histidine kinase